MSPRRVDRDARSRDLVAAATRVLARKGWAATRVEDVAAEAGVAKGTVFLYFDSREAILGAVFDAFQAELVAGARTAADGEGPALARLSALVRSLLSAAAERPDLAGIVTDLWSAGRGGDGSALDLSTLYGPYREIVAELLQQAVADGSARPDLPPHAAAVVVGAVEGVLLQWVVEPSAVSPAGMAEPVIDVLLHGLARTGGER